ncbi:hypothetical protein Egran_00921 [Elaphomyces granulatus]|uniref:Spo12 family protein n=1 Tax=Elaphomyces granulatus TaxID=519963 RepID=A0A232M4L0_9EURO|nr:hypothetical protein Egran_00921 [Elaphomyces granulatus]
MDSITDREPSQPLAERPTNTHLQSSSSSPPVSSSQDWTDLDSKEKSSSMDKGPVTTSSSSSMEQMAPELLQNKEEEPGVNGRRSQHGTQYISPSDNIMSPCTKKLSDLKGKRFKKAGKPSSLFAKLGKKSLEQSASSLGTPHETRTNHDAVE